MPWIMLIIFYHLFITCVEVFIYDLKLAMDFVVLLYRNRYERLNLLLFLNETLKNNQIVF